MSFFHFLGFLYIYALDFRFRLDNLGGSSLASRHIGSENIGEHLCSKRGLVLSHILGNEHPVPLVAADFTGLHIIRALYLGRTHNLVLLCLIDIHTGDTGDINSFGNVVEDVETEGWIGSDKLIVFLPEFHAEPVSV